MPKVKPVEKQGTRPKHRYAIDRWKAITQVSGIAEVVTCTGITTCAHAYYPQHMSVALLTILLIVSLRIVNELIYQSPKLRNVIREAKFSCKPEIPAEVFEKAVKSAVNGFRIPEGELKTLILRRSGLIVLESDTSGTSLMMNAIAAKNRNVSKEEGQKLNVQNHRPSDGDDINSHRDSGPNVCKTV